MSPVRKSSISNGTRWFYTYVLKCVRTGTFYTGTTNNLKRRLEQHNKGQVFHTKNKLPLELIYF